MKQAFACLGRRDAARGACQEPNAQPLFEFTDGLAQRRLRDAKLRCRLRKASLLPYSDKGPGVIQASVLHLSARHRSLRIIEASREGASHQITIEQRSAPTHHNETSTLQAHEALTMTSSDLTRRELLELTAATGGALAGGQLLLGAAAPAAAQGPEAPAPLDVVLRVNGTEHRLALDPRTTLIDALRAPAAYGLEERLRPRPVRGLHGADGRQARQIVPLARRPRGRARDHDH